MLADIQELNESDDTIETVDDTTETVDKANDDEETTNIPAYLPTSQSKSGLVYDTLSNDELAIPSSARGQVLSLIPGLDPGCDKNIEYNNK